MENNKSKSNFIYDDSPNMHTAISETDAYYGDESSLVKLYEATSKPVVIQKVDNINDDILVCCAYFETDNDGETWGIDYNSNVLCKLNVDKQTASFVVGLGMSIDMPNQGYLRLSFHNNDIICFPHYENNILIYNKETGETQKIMLDESYMAPFIYSGFCITNIVEFNNKIYAFGSTTEAVIIFDKETYSVSYDAEFYNTVKIPDGRKVKEKYTIYIGTPSSEGKLLVLVNGCNWLIEYDLFTLEKRFVASNKLLAMSDVGTFDGVNFWLIDDKDEKLTKFNYKTNKKTEYYFNKSGFAFENTFANFSYIADLEDYLLIFFRYEYKILKFDKIKGSFSYHDQISLNSKNLVENTFLHYFRQIDDKLYIFENEQFCTHEVNIATNSVISRQYILDDVNKEQYFEYFKKDNNFNILDTVCGNIPEFFVNTLNERKEKNVIKDETVGEKIYEYVKSILP